MSIPTPRIIISRDACSAARQYLAESSAERGLGEVRERKVLVASPLIPGE